MVERLPSQRRREDERIRNKFSREARRCLKQARRCEQFAYRLEMLDGCRKNRANGRAAFRLGPATQPPTNETQLPSDPHSNEVRAAFRPSDASNTKVVNDEVNFKTDVKLNKDARKQISKHVDKSKADELQFAEWLGEGGPRR